MENFPTITYVPINTEMIVTMMGQYRGVDRTIAQLVHDAMVFALDNDFANPPVGVDNF